MNTNTVQLVELVEQYPSQYGGEYTLRGMIPNISGETTVYYWAANPAGYHTSFTGSGIPYPNAEVAFDNTPNRGIIKTIDGSFMIQLYYPNAFYAGLCNVYVEPTVFFQVSKKNSQSPVLALKLGHSIPFRSHTYPQTRTGPMFYDRSHLPKGRTQEQILRDSGYPETNTMPGNFWGNAIPYP